MRSPLVRLVVATAIVLGLGAAMPSAARHPDGLGHHGTTTAASVPGTDLLTRALAWLRGLWPDAGCGGDPSGPSCSPGNSGG